MKKDNDVNQYFAHGLVMVVDYVNSMIIFIELEDRTK